MDSGIRAAVVLGVAILLFVICRAIVLWYWRVNESIDLLKSIDDKLGKLVSQAPGAGGTPP
jgi:hypothetical protein